MSDIKPLIYLGPETKSIIESGLEAAGRALSEYNAGRWHNGERLRADAEEGYQAALESALMGENFSPEERNELHAQLGKLRDALATLNARKGEFGVTVLFVDDEEFIRRIGQASIESEADTVLVAESAESALELARQHPGPIHLVVTDVRMNNGMDGLQLREKILAERPGTPVILATGDTYGGRIAKGIPVLQKPFTALQLQTKVRQALGRNLDPDIFRRELIAAGQRLLEALHLEDEFTALHQDDSDFEALAQWREARKLVQTAQEDYTRTLQRYLEAVRQPAVNNLD